MNVTGFATCHVCLVAVTDTVADTMGRMVPSVRPLTVAVHPQD